MNEPAMTIPEQADDSSVLQDDLRDMLIALGLPDGASPRSPHEVFRECIEAVKQMRAQSLVGVERASPPLRTREEIAQEVAKIVDEPLGDGALAACDYMGDEAADDLRKAITRVLSAPPLRAREEIAALRELYEWYDRDGSVGAATDVFEKHRALLSTSLSSDNGTSK